MKRGSILRNVTVTVRVKVFTLCIVPGLTMTLTGTIKNPFYRNLVLRVNRSLGSHPEGRMSLF